MAELRRKTRPAKWSSNPHPPPAEISAVSVAIVDDHALVRDGLARICACHPRLVVIHSGGDIAALQEVEPVPNLVLLDLDIGGRPVTPAGVEAVLRRGSAIIAISTLASTETLRAVMGLGISGIVSKRESELVLRQAIDAVIAGRSWTTPDVAVVLSQTPLRPNLSEQEQRALVLYASGLKIQSVARRLDVKPSTVREYIERVRAKYAAVGRPAPTKIHLHALAQEDGLFD